jgi:hypothetical protein
MLRGRSNLLLSSLLLLGLPPISGLAEEARRQDDLVEDLLRRFWSRAPDLASPETRAAIVADLKAQTLVGPSLANACAELGDLLERWVAGGRAPVVTREAQLGPWRGRVRFVAPGSYSAEVYCLIDGEEISAWMQVPFASQGAAWTAAQASAHQMDADIDLAQGAAMLGSDWPGVTAALERAAGQQASKNSVLVGEAESGPYTPMESLSADEFIRRHGIVDDLVKRGPPPTAEQQAKMDRWYQETLAKRQPLPVSRGEWHHEDAADRARAIMSPASEAMAGKDTLTLAKMREAAAEIERHAIQPRADGFYHLDDITPRRVGIDPAETDFHRAQRMAFNTSSDRAFASMRELGERVGKAAEHATRAVRDIAGKVRELYLPRYSAKPRQKVARDPAVKRERKTGKAARTAAKKRRGWA